MQPQRDRQGKRETAALLGAVHDRPRVGRGAAALVSRLVLHSPPALSSADAVAAETRCSSGLRSILDPTADILAGDGDRPPQVGGVPMAHKFFETEQFNFQTQ